MKSNSLKLIMFCSIYLLGGCSYSKMTHNDLMNYDGLMKGMMHKTEHTVNAPLSTVTKRLAARKNECLPNDRTTVYTGAAARINKVTNTITIKKVDSKTVQYSVQTRHSDTMMQPKDGFFSVASDITKLSPNKTHLKIVASNKQWANRLIQWANGTRGCLGYGGKK